MSKIPVTYKRSDMQSDQEVKWCPGCGDYTILASVQNFMAEMGISKEKIVFMTTPKDDILKSYEQNTSRIITAKPGLITETKVPKL